MIVILSKPLLRSEGSGEPRNASRSRSDARSALGSQPL